MTQCALHEHDLLHAQTHGERRVLMVLGLTIVTMLLEIVAGFIFNSMALTADGWHMGTHAAAFGITIFAYRYARRNANNPRFSFGTGKVGVLGGFASAVALGVVSLLMAIESIHRIIDPLSIAFDEAIFVAVVGLVVNLVSAFLLKGEHHHHAHDHGHDHGHHEDHNLKAAYFHVLADALTSITAIGALTLGRFFGWGILDPVMGVVGSLVIARWAFGLLRETSAILLDGSVEPELCEQIRDAAESDGDRVTDLHVWAVAPGHHAAILAVKSGSRRTPDEIKERIKGIGHIIHVNVEVHPA